MFGDAYVIPLTDILADIQRRMGALSVELPSTIDFSILSLSYGSSLNVFNSDSKLRARKRRCVDADQLKSLEERLKVLQEEIRELQERSR